MRDLSLHLLDLLGNSVRAGATIVRTTLLAEPAMDRMSIVIEDDGCGMDATLLASVADPFTTTRTTRRIGLGIPLFKEAAERAEGDFRIESEPRRGTTVQATFRIGAIDRLPLGDLGATYSLLAASHQEMDFTLSLSCEDRQFVFDTGEVRRTLGDVPLDTPPVAAWMAEYIEEGRQDVFGDLL